MGRYAIRGAWLLAVCMALMPAVARGQSPDDAPFQHPLSFESVWDSGNQRDGPPRVAVIRGQSPGYAPADPQLPLPLGSTRPEDGGFYFAVGGALYRQTNPLRSQPIAFRGFLNYDPLIGVPPGTIVGSATPALNVNNLNGQVGYTPGTKIDLGWKFKDGSALTLSWLYLTQTQYSNGATLVPPRAAVGDGLADTFLTSLVFNFPQEYSGPPNKIGPAVRLAIVPPPGVGTVPLPPGASPFPVNGVIPPFINVPATVFLPSSIQIPTEFVAYGIWNAASVMTIKFEQRFQHWDLTYRYPVLDQEDYRMSAIVGPRYAWIWERFLWRTVSSPGIDAAGNPIELSGDDVGIYTNITSNRMYGVHAGAQWECYLGHGFATTFEADTALFINSVKERAKYETGNRFGGRPESKRSKREWSVVPEFSGTLGLQWYPTEFIEVKFGYQLMYFMNTMSSRRPIDFNYTNLAPTWDHVNRLFDGFQGGVSFTF